MNATSCLLACVFAASGATAQHIHDAHPEDPHGPGDSWQRTLLVENWVGIPMVCVVEEEYEVLFEMTFRNCSCLPKGILVKDSTTRTHTVSVDAEVSASVTFESEVSALAQSVKAAASASVTIGAGYEWSNTVEYTVEQDGSNPPCNVLGFVSEILAVTVTGDQDVAEHMIECTCDGCGQVETRYCVEEHIRVDGLGYKGRVDTWIEKGACEKPPCPCNGAGMIVAPPSVGG